MSILLPPDGPPRSRINRSYSTISSSSTHLLLLRFWLFLMKVERGDNAGSDSYLHWKFRTWERLWGKKSGGVGLVGWPPTREILSLFLASFLSFLFFFLSFNSFARRAKEFLIASFWLVILGNARQRRYRFGCRQDRQQNKVRTEYPLSLLCRLLFLSFPSNFARAPTAARGFMNIALSCRKFLYELFL